MKLVIDDKIFSLRIRADSEIKDKKRYIEYGVILEDLISRNHVTVVNCRDLFHAISARDAIATDLLAGNCWYFIEFSDYRANDILVNKVDKND